MISFLNNNGLVIREVWPRQMNEFGSWRVVELRGFGEVVEGLGGFED